MHFRSKSSMQSNSSILLINYSLNRMPSLVVSLRWFPTRRDARGISTLSQIFWIAWSKVQNIHWQDHVRLTWTIGQGKNTILYFWGFGKMWYKKYNVDTIFLHANEFEFLCSLWNWTLEQKGKPKTPVGNLLGLGKNTLLFFWGLGTSQPFRSILFST